jgi:hypothetical protein
MLAITAAPKTVFEAAKQLGMRTAILNQITLGVYGLLGVEFSAPNSRITHTPRNQSQNTASQ